MIRIAQLFAATLVVALAAGALARPGKVVRVERAPARDPGIAACLEHSSRNMVCFAGEVERADELHVLADDGEYRRVVISSIGPSRWDSCKLGTLRDATFEVVERHAGSNRAANAASRFGMKLALKNVSPLPGRARLLPRGSAPNPEPGSDLMFAVDLDGSGRAELLVTNRNCPESRKLVPGLSGKTVRRSTCVSFWRRRSRSTRFKRVREDVVHECR